MRLSGLLFAAVFAALAGFFAFGGQASAETCNLAAEKCIDVGSDARLKITASLLQTQCVDEHGNPQQETILLEVSGEPTTGDANATFGSETIKAIGGHTFLTVHTTRGTQPGYYTLKITGTGTKCGPYQGFTWYIAVQPIITGSKEVWSFGGARPAGYPTKLTLTAVPANMGPYTWYAYDSSIRLPNGKFTMKTQENRIRIAARLPTAPGGEAEVSVSLRFNGAVSRSHLIRVLAPDRIVLDHERTVVDDRSGYRTEGIFHIADQYGNDLKAPIPLEITWVGGKKDIVETTNWTRSASRSKTIEPERFGISLAPSIESGSPLRKGIPKPRAPANGKRLVDCWGARFFVGGDDAHSGVGIGKLIWLRYRDHAELDGVSCP